MTDQFDVKFTLLTFFIRKTFLNRAMITNFSLLAEKTLIPPHFLKKEYSGNATGPTTHWKPQPSPQNASSSTHHSKRTSRSGSHQRAVKTTEEASVSQQQRLLSAPTDPDDVSEAIGPRTQDVKEGKVLGDYGSPANILRKLMHTGVDALQIGMDTFQDVSTKVYQIARKTVAPRDTVAGTGRTTVATSAESKSSSAENGRRRRWRRRGSRHTSSSAVVDETPKGLVNSVTSIIDTGIVGMQEATDIGLLLGNMGTHKFRAILDGKNGNQEVYKLLIKFIST